MPVGRAASLFLLPVALAGWFGLGCSEDDEEPAEEILTRASRVMANESFSYTVDECALCPPPILTEYAPPDAIKLSGAKGHDDWPYSLIVDGRGYVSSAGMRWLSGEGALQFTGMLLSDPRRLLSVAKSPHLEREEELDGRDAAVLAADLDLDAYIAGLPPAIEHPEESFLRGWLDGARLRFWIDRGDYRVLQLELIPADPETPPARIRFDYDTPVDIPLKPESMDAEEARRLGRDVEEAGRRLLLAIADFRAIHGAYPAALDPTTLTEVIEPGEWPANPFSGEPVRQSPKTPGDFDYVVTGSGEILFTIYGWDDSQLHYDSARFGQPERPR